MAVKTNSLDRLVYRALISAVPINAPSGKVWLHLSTKSKESVSMCGMWEMIGLRIMSIISDIPLV